MNGARKRHVAEPSPNPRERRAARIRISICALEWDAEDDARWVNRVLREMGTGASAGIHLRGTNPQACHSCRVHLGICVDSAATPTRGVGHE